METNVKNFIEDLKRNASVISNSSLNILNGIDSLKEKLPKEDVEQLEKELESAKLEIKKLNDLLKNAKNS